MSLKVLPSNFKRNNLVELDLRYSNIERLWEDTVDAPNLKWLILFMCQHLTSISNHLHAPLLEKMDLQYCVELFDFPSPDERGFKQLRELNLRGCTKLKQLPSIIHCESLRSLILSGCRNLTRILDLSDASLLEMLNLRGCESLPVFPQLAQNLQILHELDLSNCKNMSYPSDIQLESCKLLDLSGCNNLTTFPQISENITDLDFSGIAMYDEFPSLIGNMTGLLKLVTLPNSICNLVCLTQLDLSNCSNLKILPENLGNLKLLGLSVDGTAIRQLPYGMRHLNKLRMLSCCRCRGLAFSQFSSLPCSLIELYLSDCHLKEIPEDIGHLSLLLALDLSGSNFESLPVSFKQSNLVVLYLDNCNMLQSLTGIPSWLEYLSASGCKQLRSITDVPDLARLFHAKFTFTNSLNLEQTAVSNILEQLIKENIEMQDEVYGFQKRLSFFCPGSEVPGWFDHQNDEPWIQFQTKWYDHVKGEIVGFAVCAVIEFKEYNWEDEGCSNVHYGCWCSDEDKSSPHNITDAFQNKTPTFMDHVEIVSEKETLIDSDHVLLRICDVSVHSASGNEYTKYFLFKFRLSKESSHCRVKSCGVHPIYKKHNITLPNTSYENFGATDQDFGETSIEEQHKIRKLPDVVKTSGRSNEDVMEPHPKRFCS